ncbi:MAG: superoxide dismutase [Proteobacteria bacterium]|uniref:Superoxide dismutase n=1 Tax=Candidatus Enterousia avistercoris TaxID=2840788 RepID=A0A9D9DDK4_9PROT|nr:superoxide dismutase [Candidatus Enterousia avistercoris]
MFNLTQFPLQFDESALSPHMSSDTLKCHHGKHLAAYINNLNDLSANTKYADMSLVEIIKNSINDNNATKIFNNAAQVFNHDFFFHCLAPNGGGAIPDDVAHAFGGAEKFCDEFKLAASSVFGSGWAWVVLDVSGALKIMTTANADTPIAHGLRPVMALDVWEHAYYLDYQNRRADFIATFLEHMVNWNFVCENIK